MEQKRSKRVAMILISLVLSTPLLWPSVAGAAYSWVIDGGGTLNTDSGKDGALGSLASDGTNMYTAYIEDSSPNTHSTRFWAYVKTYNGTAWESVGNTTSSFITGRSTKYPDIITTASDIWVAAPQFDVGGNSYTTQLAISRWNGTDWNQKYTLYGSGANWCEAPSLAQYNGTPFVVWQENTLGNGYDYDGEIYGAQFNGTSWQVMGAGSISTPGGNNSTVPDLTVDPVTGTPYVTYIESGSIYVKRWNGIQWEQVGSGQVNIGHSSPYNPTIDHDGTNLVVAYSHYAGYISGTWVIRVYVRRWDGANWQQIGSTLNNDSGRDAWYPVIKLYGGAMYVSFEESFYFPTAHNYLKMFNGSSWETLGSALYYDVSQNVFEPDMAFHNGVPYLTWYEPLAGPGTNLAYTARLDSVLPTASYTPTVTPTPTITPTPTTTLTSTVTVTPTVTQTETLVIPGSTFTETPTITETVTMTPTVTVTPTTTATVTLTQTITLTTTITQTATISATPSITQTRTLTATISMTPSITPTLSPTVTLTPYGIEGDTVLAFPNPATDRVFFAYRLDQAAEVTIRIYDLVGNEVARLSTPNQAASAGAQSVWQLENVAPGIYLARIVIQPLDGSASRHKIIKIAVVR